MLYYLAIRFTRVVTLFTDHVYMGCYLEVDHPPDMTTKKVSAAGFTPESCIDLCTTAGFPYAAVYKGTECKCDVTFGRYGLQPDDACAMCGNSADQMCHGVMPVYLTSKHFTS